MTETEESSEDPLSGLEDSIARLRVLIDDLVESIEKAATGAVPTQVRKK